MPILPVHPDRMWYELDVEIHALIRALSNAVKTVSIIAIAVLLAGGSAWFFNYWADRSAPDDIGEMVTVQVTAEDDAASVAEKLVDAELIRFKPYFETRMRFDGGALEPGSYEIRRGSSVPEIIGLITVPDPNEDASEESTEEETSSVPESFNVTFIEGQRIEQYAVTLEEAGLEGGADAYIEAATDVDRWRDEFSFLETVPEGATLEGFLFPNTYTVGPGATAVDVIRLQLQQFDQQFTPEMRAQAEADGFTLFEAVTLASIVERESRVPEERPIIAGVYLNRLETDMVLNADPTMQYAVGTPEEWWPVMNTELLNQAYESPYDTYQQQGLPPGPIANAGFAALQAVVQPEQHDYYFFVLAGDESGRHIFTSTIEEHERVMCEEHPEYEACGGGG